MAVILQNFSGLKIIIFKILGLSRICKKYREIAVEKRLATSHSVNQHQRSWSYQSINYQLLNTINGSRPVQSTWWKAADIGCCHVSRSVVSNVKVTAWPWGCGRRHVRASRGGRGVQCVSVRRRAVAGSCQTSTQCRAPSQCSVHARALSPRPHLHTHIQSNWCIRCYFYVRVTV